MPPSLWHSVKASNQEAFPELSRNEDSPKEIQVSEQLSVEACGGGEGGGSLAIRVVGKSSSKESSTTRTEERKTVKT